MRRDLVVVGASAGGVEALATLVSCLPSDFGAALVVVLHVAASGTSVLPAILERSGALPAVHVTDGEKFEKGRVYVAPPDHHVVVHGDRLRLTRGPRVNGHRPAVDPLFMTAARWRNARAVGVVLSGVLDDGTTGSSVLRSAGAITFAQDPATAQYPSMPANAIEGGGIRHVLSIAEIATALVKLVNEELPEDSGQRGSIVDDVEDELAVDPEESAAMAGLASGFTCPDCHGALWELKAGELSRYRCRIGHSYGSESLLALQSEKIEEALWAGYRALEESAALFKRLGERAIARGSHGVGERYLARSRDAIERAKTLRAVLEAGQLATGISPGSARSE